MATATKTRAAKASAPAIVSDAPATETAVSAIHAAQATGAASTDAVIAIGYADGLADVMSTVALHKAANDVTAAISKHFYLVANYIGHEVREGAVDMLNAIQMDYPNWTAEIVAQKAEGSDEMIYVVANAPAVIGEHMLARGVQVVKYGQRPGTENVNEGCFVRSDDEQRIYDRSRKMADDRYLTPQQRAAKKAKRKAGSSAAAAKKKAEAEEAARKASEGAIMRGNGEMIVAKTEQEAFRVLLSATVELRKFCRDHAALLDGETKAKFEGLASWVDAKWEAVYRDIDGEK